MWPTRCTAETRTASSARCGRSSAGLALNSEVRIEPPRGCRTTQSYQHYASNPLPRAHLKTAVLVIDVQRALCKGDYAAFEAGRVIDRINVVTRKARVAGAPVVFIKHEDDSGLFQPGTDGWKLAEGLEVDETDLRVRKRATDSFHETGLDVLLHRLGIANLVVCGIQSEFCVDTTVRRALALGFPVVLVADGHSTMDNAVLTAAQISSHHNVTLSNITSFGPRVRPVIAVEIAFEA